MPDELKQPPLPFDPEFDRWEAATRRGRERIQAPLERLRERLGVEEDKGRMVVLFEASDDPDLCRHCGEDLYSHVQVVLPDEPGDALACPPEQDLPPEMVEDFNDVMRRHGLDDDTDADLPVDEDGRDQPV